MASRSIGSIHQTGVRRQKDRKGRPYKDIGQRHAKIDYARPLGLQWDGHVHTWEWANIESTSGM